LLKVALVTNFPAAPDRVRGGVETASLGLVRGLAAYPDLRLHIVAVGRLGPGEETWPDPPCTVYRVPTSRPGFLTAWNLTRRRVGRVLRRLGPDLVHVQGYGAWLGPRIGFPAVFTVHGVQEGDLRYTGGRLWWLKRWVVSAVEGRARGRYVHVISISPYVINELGRQIRGRVYPIDNPVEESFFAVERREVPHRLLYVGVLNERKNIHGLLEMAHRLAEGGTAFDFRIVGPADTEAYAARLRTDVERLGLVDRVHLVGSLPPEGVRKELAEAACLVLASFQETAPVVIAEAMAAGVPVVSTAVCGVPWMVEDGATGFLVPTSVGASRGGVMAAMAERVAEVLASADLRRRMGRRAVEVARARFHPAVVARKTRRVYYIAAGRAEEVSADDP